MFFSPKNTARNVFKMHRNEYHITCGHMTSLPLQSIHSSPCLMSLWWLLLFQEYAAKAAAEEAEKKAALKEDSEGSEYADISPSAKMIGAPKGKDQNMAELL